LFGLSITDFMPSTDKCLEYLRNIRWKDKRICPICDSDEVKKNGTENGKQRYYCHEHGGSFNDTTGTVFHNSKIPINKWFYFIFHYPLNLSAKILMEILCISYKTALRMAREIQKIVAKWNPPKLEYDIVEFDEMYLSCGSKGEEVSDREPRKRGLKLKGRGTMDKDKPPIIGVCDRKGNLIVDVFDHADADSIFSLFIRAMKKITDWLKVYTDDFSAYRFLKETWIKYESVNHSKKEYARGEVHNNTIEGYWSVLRHWMNTYRGVSKKYLPKYIKFFEFVENTKKKGWFEVFNKLIFFMPFIWALWRVNYTFIEIELIEIKE